MKLFSLLVMALFAFAVAGASAYQDTRLYNVWGPTPMDKDGNGTKKDKKSLYALLAMGPYIPPGRWF